MSKEQLQVEYTVVRPFKYGGKIYQPGELWAPKGFRTDETIKQTRLVNRSETVLPPKKGGKKGELADG